MINNIPYGSISTRITVPNLTTELRNKTKESSDNHLEEEDVMTLQQVSEWLGLTDEDLKKMAKADCIPVFHPAKNCFFFSRRDLLAWLEENKRGRIKKKTNTTNEED